MWNFARGNAVGGNSGAPYPRHLGGADFPQGGGGAVQSSPSMPAAPPPGIPFPVPGARQLDPRVGRTGPAAGPAARGTLPGPVPPPPPPAHMQRAHTGVQNISERIRIWCASASPHQLDGEEANLVARGAALAVRKREITVAALGDEMVRVGMNNAEAAAALLRQVLDALEATSHGQQARQLLMHVQDRVQDRFDARHTVEQHQPLQRTNDQGGAVETITFIASLYALDLLADRALEAVTEELMELCVLHQKNTGCVLRDAACAGIMLRRCAAPIFRNLGPEEVSAYMDRVTSLREAVASLGAPAVRAVTVASLDRAFMVLREQLPARYQYRPRDSSSRLFPGLRHAQPEAAAPPAAASEKGPQQGPLPPTPPQPPQPPQQQQPQGEKEDEALRLIAERPGECHGDPLAALQGLLSEVQAADQAVDGNRIAAVGAAASILCVVMADVPRQRRRYTPKELWALQPAAPTELSPLPEALVRAVHTTLGKPADPIVITAEERQSVEYLASPEELAELAEPPLSRTIYMVGLDANCSMRQLLKILLACGQVTRVRLCGDPMNPIIYGFVEYARRSAARNFLGSWHNEWIGHGRLTLSWAKSPIKDGIGEDTTAETVRLLRVRPETLNIPITQSELMEQSNRASRRNADHPPAAAARPWVQPPDHGPTPYRSGGDDQRSSSSRGSGGGGGRFKAGSSHGSAHSSGQGGSSAPGGGQPGQRGGGGSLPPQTSLAGVPWTSQRVSLSMAQAAGIGGSPVSPSLAPVQFPGGKPCGNGGGLGGALEPELPIPVQAQGRSEVPAFVYSPGQSPPPDM